MIKTITRLISACLLTGVVYAERSLILPQEGAPLVITGYALRHERERVSQYIYVPEELVHRVDVESSARQAIVAIQIGFATFGAFREPLGPYIGSVEMAISPGGKESFIWRDSPLGLYLFRKRGTGMAYVDTVQFADGTSWQADREEIARHVAVRLRQIEAENFENP